MIYKEEHRALINTVRDFAINEIHDPIYGWPLGQREFITYIKNKYGSIPAAQQGIHHYVRILRHRVEQKGEKDPIPAYKIKCDFDTYKNLPLTDREIVYYYDWEMEQNEAKRDIKIVKPEFASMIMSEHTTKLL